MAENINESTVPANTDVVTEDTSVEQENIMQQTQAIQEAAKEQKLSTEAQTESVRQDLIKQQDLRTETEQNMFEDIKESQKEIKAQEDFSQEQEDIIVQENKQLAEIEADRAELAKRVFTQEQERIDRERESTMFRQKREVEQASAEAELQKIKDNNAIKKAQQEIDVAQERATWQFNKLWLSFSTWAILQVQNIASNWAAKIAELKVQANFNQAQASTDLAILNEQINATQAEYSSQINDNINTYSDTINDIKQQSATRLSSTLNKLSLNNKERNDEINKIKKDLRTSLEQKERDFKKEQERITNNIVKKAKDLENEYKIKREQKMLELDNEMLTGNLSRMTEAEMTQKETELWLPAGTIQAKKNEKISTIVRNTYDKLIGRDYNISNMTEIVNDIDTLMKQGKDMTDATNSVLSREIKNNPEYKARQASKKSSWGWRSRSQLELDAIAAGVSSTRAKAFIEWGDDIWLIEEMARTRIRKWVATQDDLSIALDWFETPTSSNVKEIYGKLSNLWIKWDKALSYIKQDLPDMTGKDAESEWLSQWEMYLDNWNIKYVDEFGFDGDVKLDKKWKLKVKG